MSENCGNLCSEKELLTTEHVVILPDIGDCSYSRYLAEISSVVGSKHIHSIFEGNGQIKIYFKDRKYVNKIVESGILVNKDYSPSSSKDFVLLKIVLSRVDPLVPDDCIEEVLKTYGHLESPIVHTKLSKLSDFAHIDCGVREVKLKVCDRLKFPKKLHLFYKGVSYEVNTEVIEQTPFRSNSSLFKTKKKVKLGKWNSENVLNCDATLTSERFPEWCKNNPDDTYARKSQNLSDLLLQVHQSSRYLPKRNFPFNDSENVTAVLFEKNAKCPVIQEKQLMAFSRNYSANSSFDDIFKTNKAVLEKEHHGCSSTSSQIVTSNLNEYLCIDEEDATIDCQKSKQLDSIRKRHARLKKIHETSTSVSNRSQSRTKPVRNPLNTEKNSLVQVHSTLKVRPFRNSRNNGKSVCISTHSAKKEKSRGGKSDCENNEICVPSSSSLRNYTNRKKKLLGKPSICYKNVSPTSKSLYSIRKSTRKKVSSKKSDVCNNYISPPSPTLTLPTVSRKTFKKYYDDHTVSPANSTLPKYRSVKKRNSKESIVLDNSAHLSSKHKTRKVGSFKETDVSNNNVSQPSSCSSLSKLRGVKRKTYSENSDKVNSSELKSTSPKNQRAQKKNKLEHNSLRNNKAAQSVLKESSLDDCYQNVVGLHQAATKNVVPVGNVQSKLDQSNFSNNLLLATTLISTASSTSNSESQHPIEVTCNIVASDTSQLKGSIKVIEKNSSMCDKEAESTKTELNNQDSKNESVSRDFKVETALSNSITTQTNVQIPIFSCNLNNEDSSVLSVPHHVSEENILEKISSNMKDPSEHVIEDDTNIQSSTNKKNNQLSIVNTNEVLYINLGEEKKESQEEISITCSNDGSSTKTRKNDCAKVLTNEAIHISSSKVNTETHEEISSTCDNLGSSIEVNRETQEEITSTCDIIGSSSIEVNAETHEEITSTCDIMRSSSSEVNIETHEEISSTYDNMEPSPSALIFKDNSENRDLLHCKPEGVDSSECQIKTCVPIKASQSQNKDNSNSHLKHNATLIETSSDITVPNKNCKKLGLESELSGVEYVNEDENDKNANSINPGEIMSSVDQKRILHNLPNFNSSKVDLQQSNKLEVSRKCLQSKYKSGITVNPASFFIKNVSKNKPKSYASYHAHKMVQKHKNNHNTKKQKNNQNRQFLFSSTQDKNLYEYEFDSDEDYSDQVSYRNWKNQNCSSKKSKKSGTSITPTKKTPHSYYNTYLQNKKSRNLINDLVLDENLKLSPTKSKINSICEFRKKYPETMSSTSSKSESVNKKLVGNNCLIKNNLQAAGESSTKRKRSASSENLYSDNNDYFEVVHRGDGKHDKLSIIVKKKSKLDASSKNDKVNINSNLQALEIISKNYPLGSISDPCNSSSEDMNRADKQNAIECQKITSNHFIQESSPMLLSESSRNIPNKMFPKYRVKSNIFDHGETIPGPKTNQDASNFQDVRLEPEGDTINKKGVIGHSQQLLQFNCNKMPSYKIVLQKIFDKRSKKSLSQTCSRKIIKAKYRLKPNQEESISKTLKNKYINKSKHSSDKYSSNDVYPAKRNNFKMNDFIEAIPISMKNTDEPLNISVATVSAPSAVLQRNDYCDEVSLQSGVGGFVDQSASSNTKNRILVKDSPQIPTEQLQKLISSADTCPLLSKFHNYDLLQNGITPKKHLLKTNSERNKDCAQDEEASPTSVTTNYSTYNLKQCSVLLEKCIPEKLSYANSSVLLESEKNTCPTLPSNARENEHVSSSSSSLAYIKQEPSNSYTFDRINSVVEVEETSNSSISSLSLPNYSRILESRSNDCVPSENDSLVKIADNVIIKNVIPCNDTKGGNMNAEIFIVKEEPFNYESKITDGSSTTSICSLKESEVLVSEKKLLKSPNNREKFVNSQNHDLSGSSANKTVSRISTLPSSQNNFVSEISKYSPFRGTNSSSIKINSSNLSCVDLSKGINSDSKIIKVKSTSTFQPVNPLFCNELQNSVSTNSAGKLKKGSAKLTSIDKIAEFCALRKSASQIPALQLKKSLLKEKDCPVTIESSFKQSVLDSLPPMPSGTIVDRWEKSAVNLQEKLVANKKGNITIGYKSAICSEANAQTSKNNINKCLNLSSIDSSLRKEQNGQITITLVQPQGKKELTSTCVREPGFSNYEKESASKSNPPEAHADKFVPVQLNQRASSKTDSTGILNSTETYVVKSVPVKPQYVVNKNMPNPEKRILPKLYRTYPLSVKKLVAFVNCVKYTKNVKLTTLQMLERNKTPGALKDLIVQLYEYFQVCSDSNKKLQISRIIMFLNEK